jgi:hypothetical protein
MNVTPVVSGFPDHFVDGRRDGGLERPAFVFTEVGRLRGWIGDGSDFSTALLGSQRRDTQRSARRPDATAEFSGAGAGAMRSMFRGKESWHSVRDGFGTVSGLI